MRRARKTSTFDYAGLLCGRDIRNMPTPRGFLSGRAIDPPSSERLLRRRQDARLQGARGTIPISSVVPIRVTPTEFRRESRSARIATRSQFVCPRIRTYVGHVVHGCNTRDESALSENTLGTVHNGPLSVVCSHSRTYACDRRPRHPTRTPDSWVTWKWAPGNYVEQIDDRNRILINSTRDSVRTW